MLCSNQANERKPKIDLTENQQGRKSKFPDQECEIRIAFVKNQQLGKLSKLLGLLLSRVERRYFPV